MPLVKTGGFIVSRKPHVRDMTFAKVVEDMPLLKAVSSMM